MTSVAIDPFLAWGLPNKPQDCWPWIPRGSTGPLAAAAGKFYGMPMAAVKKTSTYIEAGARALLRVCEDLRKLDTEMTIQEAQTLLGIAAWPGTNVADLADRIGVERSTTSRNVSILGRHGRGRTKGLNLVESREDPEDRRYKILTLTGHGYRVLDGLIGALRQGSK